MRKKILLLLSILILSLFLAACSSHSILSDGGKLDDGTSVSVDELIKRFEPPADTISIDMTADDPSNDEITFKFQEDGKIQNYVYVVNNLKVMVTYGYDNLKEGQIWMLAFSEDGTVIAEESFIYSENEGSGFSEHNGYYFKDVDVSDIS